MLLTAHEEYALIDEMEQSTRKVIGYLIDSVLSYNKVLAEAESSKDRAEQEFAFLKSQLERC